ncbi:MAG: hypothetical protein ACRD5H_02630 [Nitrososphaerales archaeon]
MAVRVAQGLLIAALALLIIYGADAAAEQGNEEAGFIPLDAKTRGIAFGGSAVALSTAGFFVAMRQKSALVSVLLLVNGVLILIGGIMPVVAGNVGLGLPVVGMGAWVIALGIVKSVRTRALSTYRM